jgi:tRNA pseudouridine38-40 synthase
MQQMHRFRLIIEYDGRPFSGWQRQKDAPSVQQEIEEAVAKLEDGERRVVYGSGRTDAGVHAMGQVAHVDIYREITPEKLREALNHHLQHVPVSILHVDEVEYAFHARFLAKKRHYIYRILNRRAPATFNKGLVWHVKTHLDVDAMHEAGQLLVGKHDFTTFRHIHCQAESPVKTIDYLNVSKQGEEVHIKVGARSFLHHQIRSFTGTLKLVGEGKWSKEDVAKALEAKDRDALGLNAPPDGLYFWYVEY